MRDELRRGPRGTAPPPCNFAKYLDPYFDYVIPLPSVWICTVFIYLNRLHEWETLQGYTNKFIKTQYSSY
jgi:hypothetical protein